MAVGPFTHEKRRRSGMERSSDEQRMLEFAAVMSRPNGIYALNKSTRQWALEKGLLARVKNEDGLGRARWGIYLTTAGHSAVQLMNVED